MNEGGIFFSYISLRKAPIQDNQQQEQFITKIILSSSATSISEQKNK